MKKAFTIIEIIVAITVLAVGVLGISVFFSLSLKVTDSANHVTTASNLAQGVVDTELTLSYDNLSVGNGTRVRFSTDPTNPYYNYYETVNVSFINPDLTPNNAPDVGLKKIEVIIDWLEGTNPKNVQISTIKAK